MKRLKEVYIKSSDPFERGVQHGSQIREELLCTSENYKKLFEKKGYTWEDTLDMAMEYADYLDGEMPELMREIRGIARGAQVDVSLIMVMNTRYELLKFQKGQNYFDSNECTCYLVTPEATKEKETIGGQNWDNSVFIGENLYVLHIDEENGTKILGLTEPGQLIRSGMNSYGLSVNCSTLLSKKDRRGLAIPTNFMRRRILQCKRLEDARALVEGLKPCVSINYVIASREGDGFVCETNPMENYMIEPHKGIVTQGNDIRINPEIERFIPADDTHAVHFRGQRLDYLLRKKQGEITPEYIMECLKDHEGYPGSVCNHTANRECQTIASMLYCLDRGIAYICWGNPCEGSYERYEM